MDEVKFALDTFYAIMSGALVMWMAAGFTMLEAGLVQKKDVSEIVTKNLGLFSIACVMYLVCGFVLMYPSDAVFAISGGLDDAGEAIVYGILPAIGTSWGLSTDMPLEEIGMAYGGHYNKLTSFSGCLLLPQCQLCQILWKNETSTIFPICGSFNCLYLSYKDMIGIVDFKYSWIF